MHPLESAARRLRHARGLRHASYLWTAVRPAYDRVIAQLGRNGLERRVNGTDLLRIHTRHRDLSERYEPEVWMRVMSELRPGRTFVDVGAHIGLYAVAAARRVAPQGRVVAFEPQPENAKSLRAHVSLNDVAVEVVEAAVGARPGNVALRGEGLSTQADYVSDGTGIPCMTLDEAFVADRIDILKVDVEGFEEEVLVGARALLNDPARRPSAIFVEVHPFAWSRRGTTTNTLLSPLHDAGYAVRHLDGSTVMRLESWSEVVATRD